jgi:multidrug efflux pump subunit AcrB
MTEIRCQLTQRLQYKRQIGVAFLLTSVPAVLVYLPFLLLSGLVTGLFIGLCARFTLRFLP